LGIKKYSSIYFSINTDNSFCDIISYNVSTSSAFPKIDNRFVGSYLNNSDTNFIYGDIKSLPSTLFRGISPHFVNLNIRQVTYTDIVVPGSTKTGYHLEFQDIQIGLILFNT
jgi:hypothetical protein